MEKGSINLLLKILELGCDVWCCGSHLRTMRGDIAIALRISEQKDKNIDNITDLLYKACNFPPPNFLLSGIINVCISLSHC